MARNSLILTAAALALFGGAAFAIGDGPSAAAPAATSTASAATAGARDAALACDLRRTESGGVATLEAVVHGTKEASGDYRFTVTAKGSGGTSRSAQNGTFALEPKRESVLGEIGLSSDAGYEAELTLTTKAGDTVCTAEG